MGLVDYDDSASESGSDSDSTPVSGPAPAVSRTPVVSVPAPASDTDRKREGRREIVIKKPVKEPEPLAKPRSIQKPSSGSIASFLPPPTNRRYVSQQVRTQNVPQKAPPALSEGSFVDAQEPTTTRSDASPIVESASKSKFVPASVLARRHKYGDSKPSSGSGGSAARAAANSSSRPRPDQPPPKRKLGELFSYNSNDPDTRVETQSTEYEPVMISREPASTGQQNIEQSVDSPEVADEQEIDISAYETGRANKSRNPVKVVDFSVDGFYQNNEDMKKKGLLQESKRPVHTVGGGRHQLSTLVENAELNKEGLEESFTENREKRAKYGEKFGF